ncbi:MAG: hypothetical protein ACPGVU_25235 [Limisphaerales bacterium]
MTEHHQATVQYIRQLQQKGRVTKDDLIGLARFIGGMEEARTQWPGEAVFYVLHEIMDDGYVEDYELDGLSRILTGLDILAQGRNWTPDLES